MAGDTAGWQLAMSLFAIQLMTGLCILSRDAISFWYCEAFGLVDRSRHEINAIVHVSGKKLKSLGRQANSVLSKSDVELDTTAKVTINQPPPKSVLSSSDLVQLATRVLKEPGRDIKHTAKAEKAVVSAFCESLTRSVFTSHIRYERNFTRSNTDPKLIIPPLSTSERAMYFLRPSTLLSILSQSKPVAAAVLNSIGLAFIASAFAPLVWYAHVDNSTASKVIVVTEKSLSHVLGAFGFFPAFLLLGLLTYVVDRWRNFLTNCHAVQGRFHDIGVSVGGAVVDPACRETRRNLYRLYRYLNVVHAKTYANVCLGLPQTNEGFVSLCLLSQEEVFLLGKVNNKSIDVLITWCRNCVEGMIRSGQLRELSIDNSRFYALRSICAEHLDLFCRNMPNVWYAVCSVIVNYLVVLQTAHVTLQLDPIAVQEESDDGTVTPAADRSIVLVIYISCVFIFSFMMASTYWVATSMVEVLVKPFTHGPDAYNADALLASTDRMLFASFRAMFDRDDADSKLKKRNARQRWRNATTLILNSRNKTHGKGGATRRR
jgi:hypothetical protein